MGIMDIQISTVITGWEMAGQFIVACLLSVPLMIMIWMIRLVTSLRLRLTAIETKLDQLLVIRQEESAVQKPGSAEQR
jgi:hypothetical protein